jgi:hypothetical protein
MPETSRGHQALSLPSWLRECLIVLTFFAFTSVMTWPWVTRLRDAVWDNGDSYAFAWSLWWNYHQTFHDPLNLFQANIFFPYRYTLAFTEHNFGISLICFPLFALGLRPLTVLSIATFSGFALSGYGVFRLARTLTGSYGIAWTAGVLFAFVPFRFMVLPHLPYMFAAWIPLLLEAVVLFVYVRSWRRAAWLGTAFLMNGLTCISWLMLPLLPLAISVAILIVRHSIHRDKKFWVRGAVAIGVPTLLLIPFLWPYYRANKLYGFTRGIEEVTRFSASLVDWVAVPHLTKVWAGMGVGLPGALTPLFPGLVALALSFVAVVAVDSISRRAKVGETQTHTQPKLLLILDIVAVTAVVIAIISAGFAAAPPYTWLGKFVQIVTADRALVIFTLAMVARLSIAYPALIRQRTLAPNLVESLRSDRRDDAFWLGLTWAICGFVLSFGTHSFVYRALYDLILPMRSLRAPMRAAMTCYVGLALLAGLGASRLNALGERFRLGRSWTIYAAIVVAGLFELHAVPLPFIRGAVFPDAVSVQLKQTPMRGCVVDLPSLPDPPHYTWHLSMLRSADHEKPVVFAAASFIPPLPFKLHDLTQGPEIPTEFLDELERIPASYIVVRWALIAPEREATFKNFLANAVSARRLRLVGTYGQNTDLFAVVKVEPEVVEK